MGGTWPTLEGVGALCYTIRGIVGRVFKVRGIPDLSATSETDL